MGRTDQIFMDEATSQANGGLVAPAIGQRAEWVQVDRSKAEAWLARNHKNFRRLQPHQVDKIITSVKSIGWNNDGSTIKFDSQGNLVDGQHRLTAIARMDISVRLLAVHGVDRDSTVDSGNQRSLADHLRRAGVPYTSSVGACLTIMWRYENDRLSFSPLSTRLPIDSLMDVLRRHPEMAASVGACERAKIVVPQSMLGFVHLVAVEAGLKQSADRFVDLVATGANLADNDPILKLRSRMQSERGNSRRSVLQPEIKLGMIIKAWNLWLHGIPCEQLRVRVIGDLREAFPVISTAAEE